MKSAMINASDLRRSYDQGSVQALRGVSLAVNRGEFLAIMGPSGSGKSTLLNILGALDRDFEGELTIDSIDLRRLADPANFRARKIGFVFQSFHLLPTLTALENVQLPMFEMPWPKSMRERRAGVLLDWLGLGARRHHVPSALSAGERQRTAIARSLANEPQLLLADEPTGNLDSANARGILEVLQKIHREQGMTLIIVTHDPIVAAQAQHTVHMSDGQVIRKESQRQQN
jgi:putative ABC transport system ATP-binding protein